MLLDFSLIVVRTVFIVTFQNVVCIRLWYWSFADLLERVIVQE